MTPERWKQVKEVLDAALRRPPEERGPLVGEACAGDAELRAEVESLLACQDPAREFLETAAQLAVVRSLAEARPRRGRAPASAPTRS
ncbi:MAG TPA: hypothetical protein VEW48_12210 [Thermoanaerobaculia bacterium]|nr:hypothetical protein [Thermoanaerobaculia bacterium]